MLFRSRVNQFTTGSQQAASVAVNASGTFLVAWQSAGQDGNGDAVVARAYNSAGAALGSEFLVNQSTAGNQNEAAVAALSTGNFVVAWRGAAQDGSGDGVRARLIAAAGAATGAEFAVNAATAGNQNGVSLAADAQGNFIAAWQSEIGRAHV